MASSFNYFMGVVLILEGLALYMFGQGFFVSRTYLTNKSLGDPKLGKLGE
jgi:hypothetical protein